MLPETKALLLARGLSVSAISQLEEFPDDVIRRNLGLAEERQPRNLAGFLIAACRGNFALAGLTPHVAPTPLLEDKKHLKRRLRELKAEREIILSTPHVLAARFGGEWKLLKDEEDRLKFLKDAIRATAQALRGK